MIVVSFLLYFGVSERTYKNRWNDKLWIWIAERQHLSLPPQQDPFISSHFAHPELRLHKARPLITAVYLLALFVTILQNPNKNLLRYYDNHSGQGHPQTLFGQKEKNKRWRQSKQAAVRQCSVCFLPSDIFTMGKEMIDRPIAFYSPSLNSPKGSNCCEIFGGIKMWYVKRNNCRGR